MRAEGTPGNRGARDNRAPPDPLDKELEQQGLTDIRKQWIALHYGPPRPV